MNILHLEASSGWGGQEIRILREAEGMRLRGHVVFFAVSPKAILGLKAKEAGFIVYEMSFKRPLWPHCLLKLLWIMRHHKIDLVNTHSSLDSWIGGIAARIGGKKIVRTRHLSTPIKKGLNSRLLYGHLADFVVTTCAEIIPIIAEQSGKKLAQCRSIPTGVNPDKIQCSQKEALAFREKIGVGSDDFLVGTVCVMRSWKGVDDLLEAAHLLRNVPHLKWVVVGGGHAARHIEKAKELALEGIVHFVGHMDNPYPAMGALDVFALLSTANEGVSQAILQAAYLAKPLIATRIGGLYEVCIDQVTGLLVDPISPAQVKEAVLEMMGRREMAARFGRKAKELVLHKFTLNQMLDQMEKVYERI